MTKKNFEELFSLATSYGKKGDFKNAAICMAKAAKSYPSSFPAAFNLGLALKECSDYQRAADSFKKALEIRPGDALSKRMLGMCFFDLSRFEEALKYLNSAAKESPRDADIWYFLGIVLRELSELEAAQRCFEKAVRLRKNFLEAEANLCEVIQASGRVEEALELIKKMIPEYPDGDLIKSSYLFWLHYPAKYDRKFIFGEHLRLGKKYGGCSCPDFYRNYTCPLKEKDVLRIGYVSPDFKKHSVAWFFEPVLKYSGERVENYCYSNVKKEDSLTGRFRELAACFRDISGISDREAAQIIHNDGIDILVDLAGHTLGNRLGIFVLKPAPVQVTYLGYPDTTGLDSMDYRISDSVADPFGSENICTEKLVRLPGCFLCYNPPLDAPDVSAFPAEEKGFVTFGCFNNISKISGSVLESWAKILEKLPDSRLFIKNRCFDNSGIFSWMQKRLSDAGIDTGRVDLKGFISSERGHLEAYRRVDISLDTYPYNGTTTTCESLWMGVPVITLTGDRHSSRVSTSILSCLGLEKFSAGGWREYIDKAVDFASDLNRLRCLRKELRKKLLDSPLCDGPGFVSSLEKAYKNMCKEYRDRYELQKKRSGETAVMNSSVSDILQTAYRMFKEKNYVQSERLFRQVISAEPDNDGANYTLALIMGITGRDDEAMDLMEKVLKNRPDDPSFYYNYASMLQKKNRYRSAETNYKTAVRLRPDYSMALNNLGTVLLIQGKLTEAKQYLKRLIDIEPGHYLALNNLGNVYKDQGLMDKAAEMYRKTIGIKPDYSLGASNYLMSLCYRSDITKDRIYSEHRDYEKRLGRYISASVSSDNNSDPDRRPLRVGYVSPDFRTHSVSFFFRSIIENHNRNKVLPFCYYNRHYSDDMTVEIMKKAYGWRSIYGIDDESAAKMIRNDGIDILVDLAGHTGDNRMLLFLRRPAPVQVTYLGYPNTSGLSMMDFRLTDRIADPEGEEKYYTERLFRLDDAFLCYSPLKQAPDPGPLPAKKNGYVTFGSFNNLSKISPEILGVWINIMNAVPDSRIVLKARQLNDEGVRRRFAGIFEEGGINRERVKLLYYSSSLENHLKEYGRVDIGLDTFPYNGTTTTFEALMMGVPVITCSGNNHASRVGRSILTNLGLSGMITDNKDQYLRLACFLSKKRGKLKEMRRNLRKLLFESTLCNGKFFTERLEKAYIYMWKEKNSNR